MPGTDNTKEQGGDVVALVPSAGSAAPSRRKRPVRTTALPEPVTDRTLDYAASREELKGIEPGEVVLAVEELEGFKQMVAPELAAVDRERQKPKPGESKRRGPKPRYHALDYWRLEVLRRVIGSRSTQDTRDWLTTDKARVTRELLGFGDPRPHFGGKPRKWMAGIPSDGWMSDIRTGYLPEAKLAELFEATQRWGLAEKIMTIPGMAEELRVLYADGSIVETHATPPKYREVGTDEDGKKLYELINADSVTAPEAGYIGKSGPDGHSGSGWNVMFITTSKGTILGTKTVPLHHSEPAALASMTDELAETLSWVESDELRVLSADAAFHSNDLRKALRKVGIVENIHLSSHARKAESLKAAQARDKRTIPFTGYKWSTNGHREMQCDCGKGKVARDFDKDRTGRAITRLKGECRTCGSLTVTSGAWRFNGTKTRWVKVGHNDREDGLLELGNALTFNDPQANALGAPRFASQEGVFGSQFSQRFRLFNGKRWFYRQTQPELDVAAVVTITHALSLERYRRQLANEQAAQQLPAAA